MTPKFGLLSDLEEDSRSPKRKFQVFEARVGSEEITAFIPVESANAFEADTGQTPPTDKASLIDLVIKHGGEVA